ncbi:MAG: SH3 domain-containing protein [Rhodobacter sp.]|nr:SH3 domain-containing protein [Rhodobacter sp.]
MLGRLHVTADHAASYSDPISVAAGECIVLTGRSDLWDGQLWLWAHSADGREGWVPDGLVAGRGRDSHLREAYSARELSCRTGDILTGLRALNGWVWCRDASGAVGWVPARCLTAA